MLEEAKSQCDHLIVALHTNPQTERSHKNKPIESSFERFLRLKACRYIDEIIPYDTEADLYNILLTREINVRFLGSDYKDKPFTGDDLGIPIYFIDRKHSFSSSDLRRRIALSLEESDQAQILSDLPIPRDPVVF
jgi:glycerol-3-phosphate cytidylyltransferase